MKQLAPIVLFTYNRPNHTRETVEALQKNVFAGESEFFIYSDAPKNKEAEAKVKEAREYIKTIEGFKKVTIIERDKNWGLADSIIDGVTKIVNEYGRIIVLEDDLVTSPYFLKYMNDSLEFYHAEEQVMQISGYSYIDSKVNVTKAVFLPFASSWGWATWKRAWNLFDPDAVGWKKLLVDKKLRHDFDLQDCYNYSGMMFRQMRGDLDSWAIRWNWIVFSKKALVIYPPLSLVNNNGFDGSGIHCRKNNMEKRLLTCNRNITFPVEIKVKKDYFIEVRQYLMNIQRSSFIKKIKKIQCFMIRVELYITYKYFRKD